MEALRVRVSGRVQGVFFRQSTAEKAAELKVSGWVQNCRDGTVEVFLQGDSKALDILVEWLHHGPPLAKVMSVEITDDTIKPLTGFEVRN